MSQISGYRLTVATCLLAFAAVVPLSAQDSSAQKTAVDSTLFTTYRLLSGGGQTNVSWVVCGSTQETFGCYASGSLGPFVGVGAMLESDAAVKGDVVTRDIYVVDSGSTTVKLYVYKKVDTVTSESDSVTVTLERTITLPLTGGSTVLCSMAANSKFLFIGTDQDELAAMVQKSTFAITQVGDIDAPGVTSITSDQYGYVTVTLGTSGFTVFGPSGEAQEDGGGGDFIVGTTQSLSSTAFLASSAPSTPQLVVHPKGSR
jgi:hypothetical protein